MGEVSSTTAASKQTRAYSRKRGVFCVQGTIEEKKWVKWVPSRVWRRIQWPSAHSHTPVAAAWQQTSWPLLLCLTERFTLNTQSLQRCAPNRTLLPIDTCYFSSLEGELQSHIVFHCYFHHVLFLCVFWMVFSRFPFRWSLTCHCYLGLLPCRSWGSWTRNTGTNRGRESGDEGHCLSFICVTSPSFTHSYKCPSIPSPMWSRITPRNIISSSVPSSPTMITGFTAERRNTQTSVASMGRLARLSPLHMHSWH